MKPLSHFKFIALLGAPLMFLSSPASAAEEPKADQSEEASADAAAAESKPPGNEESPSDEKPEPAEVEDEPSDDEGEPLTDDVGEEVPENEPAAEETAPPDKTEGTEKPAEPSEAEEAPVEKPNRRTQTAPRERERPARPAAPGRERAREMRPPAAKGDKAADPQTETAESRERPKDAPAAEKEAPKPADSPKPGEPEMPPAAEQPREPAEQAERSPRGKSAQPRPVPATEEAPVDPPAVSRSEDMPPAEEPTAESPPSEPEQQAEIQVQEATREVEREIGRRAADISGREDARALIDEIIGAESRISRAEIEREDRIRPRMDDRRRRGSERGPEVSPEQRRDAVAYFQRRLRGEGGDTPPPIFFRQSEYRRDGRDLPRVQREVIEERVEIRQPRYLNEGRRYVHFDSRASIPAILLAAQAMNRVRFQPAREIAPMFYERGGVPAPQDSPLPPANYRDENALAVSYSVDEASLITSDDILFKQGSTQFADPFSYEIVSTLADAMKELPQEERFAIEGHASAEGSYDSNMILSQQRAERIVREMVRRGVSPYRLLPVGYGESEARHPANAAESLRQEDRRVMVFRLNEEPMANR